MYKTKQKTKLCENNCGIDMRGGNDHGGHGSGQESEVGTENGHRQNRSGDCCDPTWWQCCSAYAPRRRCKSESGDRKREKRKRPGKLGSS